MGFEFCEAHFSKEETNLISLLALISSTISMFGSSYMLLSYFLFSTRKNPLSKLVAWLAFADYLVSLNNIIKTSIIYADPDWYVWPLCVSMRVYFQLTAGATCGYTTCIAFFLWRSLWFHKTRVRRWEWALFHGLSWGIPLVCVVGLVSGDLLTQSPNLYLCFPKKPWHIILWFAPVLASFGLNLLFYLLIIYRIRKIKREQKAYLHATQYHEVSTKLSKVILRFSFYLLVFFVCWVFDVLTYVVGTIDPSCGAIIFTILYSILLNLQGGLDFLVYGVTNDNIYKRFTSRSTVVHSLFEFCLSPLLVFPAFLIYLRKVLRARRSKAARQHLQHMRDPKLHHGSFRSGRLSSVELDSARESGEDEAGLEEDDFEEGHRGVLAAFVRGGGGATPVAPSPAAAAAAAEQTSLLRSRRKGEEGDDDHINININRESGP